MRNFTHQILLGLVFLHSHKVVHCDIKGANILISEDGIIKLTDFNSSRLIGDLIYGGDAPLHSIAGTPHFMAPEVIRQSGHGAKADIWSVGCTVIQMLTAAPPWNEHSNRQTIFRVVSTSGKAPRLPNKISEECKEFLDACFHFEPRERPDAVSLLNYVFCSQVGTGAVYTESDGAGSVCAICKRACDAHVSTNGYVCYVYDADADGWCSLCGREREQHVGQFQYCPVWVSASTKIVRQRRGGSAGSRRLSISLN